MDMRILLVAIVAVFAGLVFAGSCPSGAADCFLCGGVDGIPCTTNCTGAYVEGVGNVACQCPQGEPCVCHCPYGGGAAVAQGNESLLAGAQPCPSMGCSGGNCALVKGMSGRVAVKKGGSWCIASEGQYIAEGDRVWVLDGGAVRIMLYSGEYMDAAENSAFTVKKLEKVQGGATRRLVLDMVDGAYHFLIDKKRIEPFEVRMDSAFAGIVGTEFLMEADGSGVTIKVLEGEVSFSNDGSGKTVSVREGEYSEAPAGGGAPSEPAAFDAGREKKWWGEVEGSGCGSAFVMLALLGATLAIRGG